MTSQRRPNLGGLFDGSTPADRTSSIAGRLGPRLVPAVDARVSVDALVPNDRTPPAESDDRPALGWLDPIKALQLYFGLLQSLLDANRDFTMTVAQAVLTVPRRLR